MLAPSGRGLIIYQDYGNLYAMTGRKAHLLEDKQIPSVGVFDEVFSIWKAFGGNTRDLGSFGEETGKSTDLHQHLSRISTQKLETASQITRGTVTTHLRTASQPISRRCHKISKRRQNFKFSKHDTSLEKMIEMIEKEYESNVSKIFITRSTFETKNLELVKEMGDIVKSFDEEKKAFETKILKLEKVLAQRVKDFDDVKTELSKRTDKFETYFANLEKENALLKSQLASQN
ncbi:hypothetical protein Tco_1410495 [Tanacetum coccineum]